MTLLKLQGKETDDKESAYGAFLDAYMTSLQARQDYPAFGSQQHVNEVDDFKNLIEGFTNFKLDERKKGTRVVKSNFYENQRPHVKKGGIDGPATELKYIYTGQGNFTPVTAAALDAYLGSDPVVGGKNFNVLFHPSKPHCVVQIELA